VSVAPQQQLGHPTSVQVRLGRILGHATSFGLAAIAAFAATLDVTVESFHSARLAVVMAFLLLLHLAMDQRLPLRREGVIYACFVAYMLIELLWTDDLWLAMNTVIPAVTFLLASMLFASLAAYHDLRSVLAGTLCGILAGAAFYTAISGFPFTYPHDFSYNAIAGMYLAGLFVALLASCYARSRLLLIVIGCGLLLHLLATTSIKFNLGVLLGVAAASVLHFRHVGGLLRRHAFLLLLLVGALGYAAASNEALRAGIERGADRVALGVAVLEARENLPGYSAFQERARWQSDGLRGWLQNPLFGHGVEAFRSDFGITSHSTPIDVLYNSGLIGCTLFYAIFLSLMRRVRHAPRGSDGLRTLILGACVCYAFVSLSAPLHYNTFFAVFVGLSSALLGRRERHHPANHAGTES
jgi:hypothetical protein